MTPSIAIIILGASMVPTFLPGSRHRLVFTRYVDLRRGMTVDYVNKFYREPLTAHRIVAGETGHWVAKGDANTSVDPGYVTPENYIGQIK